MDIERYSTNYTEIRYGSPCSEGLRKFYKYMGGMQPAQSAKRISLIRILHNDPSHFAWMVARKRLTPSESVRIQKAYSMALVHCDQQIVVNEEHGASMMYNVNAITIKALADAIVAYAESLLEAAVERDVVLVVVGMNPK